MQEFKDLGSTVLSNWECAEEVKKLVQVGWSGWRRVSGVICDRRVAAGMKGKGFQDGGEISSAGWFRDGGSDQKRGGRDEDVQMFSGSEEDRQG